MYDVIEKAILEYLEANWSDTPVDWPNSGLRTEDMVDGGGNKIPWIRPTIEYDEANNIAIGSKAQRYTGILDIQIFVGENDGTKDMRAVTKALHDLLVNTVTGGVTFLVPNLSDPQFPGGVGQGWFQRNLETSFRFDNINP